MSRIRFTEQTEPSTPPTNTVEVYPDSGDGKLKVKKDDGSVVDLEGPGGGGGGGPHASTHNAGGSDPLAIDSAAATGSLRTLGTSSTSACAGNDSRLSNARTPLSHASSHQPGGGDAMAVDAAGATGSLRTLGTSSTAACAGNDARLSDSRNPNAHAASHSIGGGDAITDLAGVNVEPLSSDDNPVIRVRTMADSARIIIRAHTSAFSGESGVIEFIDTDGTTIRNFIYGSTGFLSGSTFKPLVVRNGLWVNAAQDAADTQISGVSIAPLLYVAAANNRLGVGTSNPQRLFHITGDGATPLVRLQASGSSANEHMLEMISGISGNGYVWTQDLATTEDLIFRRFAPSLPGSTLMRFAANGLSIGFFGDPVAGRKLMVHGTDLSDFNAGVQVNIARSTNQENFFTVFSTDNGDTGSEALLVDTENNSVSISGTKPEHARLGIQGYDDVDKAVLLLSGPGWGGFTAAYTLYTFVGTACAPAGSGSYGFRFELDEFVNGNILMYSVNDGTKTLVRHIERATGYYRIVNRLRVGADTQPNYNLDVTGNAAVSTYIDMPAISAPANPASGTRRIFVNTATNELSVRTSGGTTVSLEAGGGGGGEANTASNIGAGGIGVFDAKVGVDLQFRNINVVDTARLTVAHDDPNNEVDLDIPTNAIDNTRLRDSAGFSVIGKATTGTGDPADITAADETVLGRTGGGNVAFAQVATGQIANDAVTYAKLQNLATDRLLGRDTASSGDAEELTVGGGVEFTGSGGIQRSALTGDVTASAGSASTTIANDAVTYAKLQNVAGFSVVGKATTGSGDAADITASDGQVLGRTGGGNVAFGAVQTDQIANDAVTYAKIQTVTDARLLGRSAGSNGDCQEITVGSGLSLTGGEITATGGGGGDVVTVNGSSVTDADLDDATPTAPAGGSNVKWQTSGSGPANISAYMDWATPLDSGIRRKPFFFTDMHEASTSTTLFQPPWTRSAVSSGTMAAVAGTGAHPGILRVVSAAGANTGGAVLTGGTAILLAGGETFEAIINIDTLTNTTIRIGFMDSATASIDGAFIEIPSTGAAVGKTVSNSTTTTSSTIATLSTATWYRCRVQVNSGATSVAFTIWTDDGTQQGTQSNSANIPTSAGRETGHGISCVSQSTVNVAQIDWLAMWYNDRALTR